jgi:HPt (histidine-containing phosphotransfer) domain-containing protein
LIELGQAIGTGNPPLAQQTLHALRGAAAAVLAHDLLAAATALEQQIKTGGDPGSIRDLLDDLEAEFIRLSNRLQQHLNALFDQSI